MAEAPDISRDHTTAIMRAEGVTRSFGATRALAGADMALLPGEVHALLGENGAGKSTFVKILVGALQPDAGRLFLDGAPVRFRGVRDAVARGVVPIYQQLTLMPHLSVAENLFAFEWARGAGWRLRPPRLDRARAAAMLATVGLEVAPETPVGALSLAERQLVEIARGVARDCRLLVLDEPTTALNHREVARLFEVVRDLCRRGKAVLFITHSLSEVEEIADRVTVLRDGASVMAGAPRAGLTSREIVERMIGRSFESQARFALPEPGDEVLAAERIATPGAFADVSLMLRRGELLGIVGLIGSGATRLGRALGGAFPVRGGEIRCGGRKLAGAGRADFRAAGIGLIPSDRQYEGVFPGRPVGENCSASILEELAPRGWLRPRSERRRLAPWMAKLKVVPSDPAAEVQTLSGGNQQKTLVIRNLAMTGLRVLIALEPSRGVDVGAREEIRHALVEAARQGAGIVVVSSELEEVLTICHRVLVMRDGRVAATLPGESPPSRVLAELTGAGR